MAEPKLTKLEIEFLRESAEESECKAIKYYIPALKLSRLGLVNRYRAGYGVYLYRITDAGRAALAALEAKDHG